MPYPRRRRRRQQPPPAATGSIEFTTDPKEDPVVRAPIPKNMKIKMRQRASFGALQ
jgi:hypothetical protein